MTDWVTKNIYRFLDTDGDGGGTKNANVNGSVTPQVFKFIPTGFCEIARMIVHIEDGLTLSADDYGNVGVLSNGVDIKVHNVADDAVLLDLLDGVPIKNNAGWGRVCYDIGIDDFGAGNNFVKVRWTFSRSGKPLRLAPTEYLGVTINDDLTGLIDHRFMIQGQYK